MLKLYKPRLYILDLLVCTGWGRRRGGGGGGSEKGREKEIGRKEEDNTLSTRSLSRITSMERGSCPAGAFSGISWMVMVWWSGKKEGEKKKKGGGGGGIK